METRGASSPGILVLTTGLSRPFMRLDKYPTLLKELERHMEVLCAAGRSLGIPYPVRETPSALQGQDPPACFKGVDVTEFQKWFCEIPSFLLIPAP